MKKTIYILLVLLLLLPITIKASNFTTSLNGNKQIYQNTDFTVVFSVSNAENVMGINGKLNYDNSKLTIVSSTGLNGFNLTLGKNIVVDSTAGKSGSFSFASVTFKATGNFAIGDSTTISFTNVTGSNGSIDISGSNSSATISVIAPKSTNNNLAILTINDKLVSGFNTDNLNYTMTFDNAMASINIKATVADSKSTVTGTGVKQLKVYANTFKIVVTAENGSKKTYTLNIIRKDNNGLTRALSTNNLLESLIIDGYDLDFNNQIITYSLEVENNINRLSITAKAQDSNAKIAISDDNLKVGNNTITIKVTAENNAELIYTLIVKRKNEGPTTTLDKLLTVINNITSNIINIDINDDNTTLNADILASIKNKSKNVIINYYHANIIKYKWELSGVKISSTDPINLLIAFDSPNKDKILTLTNYADNMYLNFSHNGVLPAETYVSINVADKYRDGAKVKLYYYNEDNNKIDKVYDDLVVENGYLRFKLEHCSEYILSMAEYNVKNNDSIYQIIISILGLIIFLMIGIYLINKNKKKSIIVN